VVDLGTTLYFDVVSEKGEVLGGMISPIVAISLAVCAN
jgi:pantothenate kinase type III